MQGPTPGDMSSSLTSAITPDGLLSIPTYKHQPLVRSEDEFRLCRLLPPVENGEDVIRLTIKIVTIQAFGLHGAAEEEYLSNKGRRIYVNPQDVSRHAFDEAETYDLMDRFSDDEYDKEHGDELDCSAYAPYMPKNPRAYGREMARRENSRFLLVNPYPRAYTALSYTWGASSLSHEILIDDCALQVSSNLWQFLKTMLFKGKFYSWYFIDQICINQSDTAERNHQVKQMGDIYARAGAVCIWLGLEADGSDTALSLCELYHKKFQRRGHVWDELSRRLDETRGYEETTAFRRLMKRPYWSRIWIVQEIFHARKVLIRCGMAKFPAKGYASKAELKAVYTLTQQVLGTNERHPIYWPTTQSGQAEYMSLFEAVKTYCDWGCVDQKDKVLGLLGCVDPKERVNIDYAKSIEDVFWDAVDKICLFSAPRTDEFWAWMRDSEKEGLRRLRNSMGLEEAVSEVAISDRYDNFVEPRKRNRNEKKPKRGTTAPS